MSLVSWYHYSHLCYIYEEVNSFLIFRNWRTECQINCEWTSESRKVSAGHLDMICFHNSMLIVWLRKAGNETFSQEYSEAIGIRMRIQCTLPTSELGCQFVCMSLVSGNIKLKVFHFGTHCWNIFIAFCQVHLVAKMFLVIVNTFLLPTALLDNTLLHCFLQWQLHLWLTAYWRCV